MMDPRNGPKATGKGSQELVLNTFLSEIWSEHYLIGYFGLETYGFVSASPKEHSNLQPPVR